jgi:hypothetical protein
MEMRLPFYSSSPENSGLRLYHTHHRCRIAQEVAIHARVPGKGASRQECPFCFMLGQFQVNKSLRSSLSACASTNSKRSSDALTVKVERPYQTEVRHTAGFSQASK